MNTKTELKNISLALFGAFTCFLFLDFCVGKFLEAKLNSLPADGERVSHSNYAITKAEADVIIIGSSRALCHYDPYILMDNFKNMSFYNCGIDGQDFYYENALIQSIVFREKPKAIILDLKLDEFESHECNLSLLYPYYYTNTKIKSFIDKYDPSAKWKLWLASYRYNASATRIFRATYTNQGHAYYGYLAHKSSIASKSFKHKTTTAKQYEINIDKLNMFIETINLLHDNGINLYVVVSPIFYTIIGKSSTITMLEELSKKYEFLFIDDSQLPDFIGNVKFIYDENHLNDSGAKHFTTILASQLTDEFQKSILTQL